MPCRTASRSSLRRVNVRPAQKIISDESTKHAGLPKADFRTVSLIGVAVNERQRRNTGIPVLCSLSLRQLRLGVAQLDSPQDHHKSRTTVDPFNLRAAHTAATDLSSSL